jgi:hypothetical protein
VPISVIYSGSNYSNVFGDLNVMPMVNIYQFDQEQPELAWCWWIFTVTKAYSLIQKLRL